MQLNAIQTLMSYKLLRGPVVQSVVLTTAMIARLMVQHPPKPRCCVLG